VRDGMIMLKVIHKINPDVVEWNRVETKNMNIYKVGINCDICEDAMRKMKIKLIGIGARDI